MEKDKKITSAIRGILNDLLAYAKEDSYPAISFEDLTSIVIDNDKDNVLNDINYIESRKKLEELMVSDYNLPQDTYKSHFIENSFIKGVSLKQELEEDKNVIKVDDESLDITLRVLEADALIYRHNNDKETYIAG
ncbi:hypothetical protein [Aquimarina megaterium]|uniref:hypothetical protein n=1 Tax=Aquimarina megaterium TaxID=1443666 RepID=UPI0004714A0F|nr:hypothetical protein [Aquimarina megaterium]